MVDDTAMLSKPVAYGIMGVGFLIAAVLSIQLALGVVNFSDNPPVFAFSYLSTLVFLPTLMILAANRKGFVLAAMIWLHLSMGVMLLYFSQTYSPFTVAWAILILLATIHYRWKGFWLSGAGLAIIAVLYIVLFPHQITDEDGGVVGYSFLSALVVALTVFTSYMFVTVIMSAQKKNLELLNARRSEQYQINRLNTLLNSINDAVVTLNRYGRITSQNAAAQVFFDTNQSLIGREIDRLLALRDSSDQPVYTRQLIDATRSSLVRDDLSSKHGKEVRHLSLQLSRIRGTFDDSEEYGVVMIIRDITKQKSLEEEKDEFISVTSHELRTPVAIAEGSLSNLLLLDDRNAERSKLRAAAEDAHKQIIYLANMINDLSTLSRAERGVGDVIEEIDVNALMHDLFNRYTPEAETKKLLLNLDSETSLPKIETSRLYLEEILQNFITNAIKYTKEGSVTIGAKMEGDTHIRFFVKDTGIGMSQYDQEHIFQKFYRSEDYRTRETSGTGLGLYVVAKLAQKLNTKIDVQSRLDHGSTFSFALPLQTTNFDGSAPRDSDITTPSPSSTIQDSGKNESHDKKSAGTDEISQKSIEQKESQISKSDDETKESLKN